MSKLHDMGVQDNNQRWLAFECPGCGFGHHFEVPLWEWNGSMDCPTFSPSLLVNGFDDKSRCHSFVRDGRIEFMSDCAHAMAGQTVEIGEWS